MEIYKIKEKISEMIEVMTKVDTPLSSLSKLIKPSKSLYDIVAACYHTIFCFQQNNEPEFIFKIDELSNKTCDDYACYDILENFREEITSLFKTAYEELGFEKFLGKLTDGLKALTCPPKIEKNTFVSFCAFYIIEQIDFYLEAHQRDMEISYPNHGPLNENVCTDQCCVYFNEKDSFLSSIYRNGNEGFRKPLHKFRIGSVFGTLLMFESSEFKSSIPHIVPVCVEGTNKQKYMETHQLRIASIPFIGNKTFDFCDNSYNEPCSYDKLTHFYIRYDNTQESECIPVVIHLLDVAIEKKANIIIFPEYIMSHGMLDAIKKHLKEMILTQKGKDNQLLLVLAGTNYEYKDSREGNNILHILTDSGKEIGTYYKYHPFLTQCKYTAHGSTYGDNCVAPSAENLEQNNKTIENRNFSKRRYIQNLEFLSNPGKECTIVDLSGVGRILPSICRDAIDGEYTDTLANLFMPSLLLISAWSASVSSFNSRLSTLSETIHTTSLLCNCCNAVEENKKVIGEFVYPSKQDSKMVAKVIPLNRECEFRKECIDTGGCMHLIGLDFGGDELIVNIENILINTRN